MVLLLGVASSAFAQTATVTAAWDANTDNMTAGYMVYYGSSSGSYQWSYDAGNQTSAQLSLTRGANYYFTVRGYNSSAQLGPASTETMFALASTVSAPTAAVTATLQNATTALVSWQTTNAVSATVNGVSVGLTGSTSVAVSATTTFTIVATSANGQTVTRSATVTVAAASAPTASITASMQNATTALVTWQTANASSATVNGTSVGLSGSASVPVSATTTFTIVARNAAGQTATRSATVTVATPVPVPAPTASITATLSGTAAQVSWQSANATSAKINGVSVALTGSTSVQVSATTTFTIVATSASGQTATRSATVTVTAPPPASAVPNAPTRLETSVERSRVRFVWRAPSSGATPSNYLIDVGVSGSSKMIASAYPVGNVLTVATDLPNGRYWTRVRAGNSAGIGAYSNFESFRIGRSIVSPKGFTVKWVGSTAVLSWTVAAGDGSIEELPTGYVLEAGTAPGLTDVATVKLGNVTSLSVPIPAGTYYVRLRAENSYGDSDPTPDLVLAPPGTIEAPTSFLVSRVNGAAHLRWNAPATGVATGYVIEVGSAPGLTDITQVELGNVTQFSAPAPAGTFYLRVRAKNAVGAGLPSNESVLR